MGWAMNPDQRPAFDKITERLTEMSSLPWAKPKDKEKPEVPEKKPLADTSGSHLSLTSIQSHHKPKSYLLRQCRVGRGGVPPAAMAGIDPVHFVIIDQTFEVYTTGRLETNGLAVWSSLMAMRSM